MRSAPLFEPAAPLEKTAAAADFEILFVDAPCGYLVMAPDGRIVRANATFARWIGFEVEDLLGKRLRDFLTVAASIFYETTFAPLLRLQNGFEEVAIELVAKTGETLPVLVNASAGLDAEGRLVDVRIILIRARQRMGYERDLQSREATAIQALLDEQSTSGLREQFIAVLGHDLRNPLASVSSGVRLLQRDPSKERADQIAGMMQASVLRMSGMIENVLDFARGRLGGGIHIRRGLADLESIVLQVVDELRSAHPGRGIEVHYDLAPIVDCDGSRISQMLSNLVGNACTHGDPATSVVVRASQEGGDVEISVANGGEPISERKLETIFQPFSREPDAVLAPGLGLGLFIASEIAKSHGGALTAASSSLETRFTFRMPMAPA